MKLDKWLATQQSKKKGLLFEATCKTKAAKRLADVQRQRFASVPASDARVAVRPHLPPGLDIA